METAVSGAGGRGAGDGVVAITGRARDKIREIFGREGKGPDTGVRLGVVGGGCSGLSYKIDFDVERDRDHILDLGDGVRVLIDLKSAVYLKDSTLDFGDGLDGKGFVFKNPNATNTCGCGESFSP